MEDKYHHGNLRQALIDHGIRIINEEGEQSLSLRKVAAACGVSHSAPYAHFKDKEELLSAIKASVTERFTEYLYRSVDEVKDESAEKAIVAMGRSYVKFFLEHPDYYQFLFYNQKITVHLTAGEIHEEDYPPYLLLKELFFRYLGEKGIALSDEEKEIELIKIWSTVQGIASIACMENVKTTKPWEDYLDKLIH
ncbi:MAG: TetR/AcrR family transcriptional regulator [Lachnospiraceae bacterium]|nr:TetR/AcrR family transcriptional regulator [Lachnospiraceae bacterium]